MAKSSAIGFTRRCRRPQRSLYSPLFTYVTMVTKGQKKVPRVNETFSEGSNHHMYLLTVDVVWVIGQKRAFFLVF